MKRTGLEMIILIFLCAAALLLGGVKATKLDYVNCRLDTCGAGKISCSGDSNCSTDVKAYHACWDYDSNCEQYRAAWDSIADTATVPESLKTCVNACDTSKTYLSSVMQTFVKCESTTCLEKGTVASNSILATCGLLLTIAISIVGL